jgi:[acyl-carrier-protein] S-malonyltransferase
MCFGGANLLSKIAYLFPGQGSQAVGMGADFCAHSPAARALFDEADQYLGTKLSTLCFYGPEDALRQTVTTQPALYVTSAAGLQVLREAGVPPPAAAAGHSIGEYAALYAAGAFSFTTGLEMVEHRAREMHRATLGHPGAMAAVLGLSAPDVMAACRQAQASGAGSVEAANFNGAGQVVISGTPEGVAAASEIAKTNGAKRVLPLNVSGAFHSPLMAHAAESMAHFLETITIQQSDIPVVANLTADYETNPEQIKANLAAQIDHPVRWEETIMRLVHDGFDTFVEIGSGSVLTGLMKRLAPEVSVLSVNDMSSALACSSALLP